MDLMNIARRDEGVAVVLDLTGEVSLMNCRQINKAVSELIREKRYSVIINLVDVPFVDSSGIGTFIAAYSDLKRYGGALILASVPEPVLRTLEVTNVLGFFRLHATVEDAVAELSASGAAGNS